MFFNSDGCQNGLRYRFAQASRHAAAYIGMNTPALKPVSRAFREDVLDCVGATRNHGSGWRRAASPRSSLSLVSKLDNNATAVVNSLKNGFRNDNRRIRRLEAPPLQGGVSSQRPAALPQLHLQRLEPPLRNTDH